MFLRSFAIQGSWNYRTLIGTGFAFALLPALREIFRGRPAELQAAVERHTDVFNSHPYLSGVALGAVARLEQEGADPGLIARFKAAVRGSLGSLGDRLVWAGWRPTCMLLALILLFLGETWWVAILVFLILYNAGHLLVRVWGFQLGLRYGRMVGEHLRRAQLADIQRFIASAGAFLLGFLLPVVATGGLVSVNLPRELSLVALLAAAVGVRFGGRVRRPVVVALAGIAIFGLVLQVAP